METKKWSKHSLGVAFVLGMMILGGSLILMISNLKSYDRCVTVKGLCEKEVMADKVIGLSSISKGAMNWELSIIPFRK